MRAMAQKSPDLAEIPRLIEEGLALLISVPEERAKLRRTTKPTERLGRRKR